MVSIVVIFIAPDSVFGWSRSSTYVFPIRLAITFSSQHGRFIWYWLNPQRSEASSVPITLSIALILISSISCCGLSSVSAAAYSFLPLYVAFESGRPLLLFPTSP